MAKKYKLVQNDTLPEIYLWLSDEATGQPIDLSDVGTSIHLYFRKVGDTVLKDTLLLAKLPGTVTFIDEDTGEQTVKLGPPYTADGSGGRCAIQWGPTSLNTPGEYEGEVEITFVGGGRLTGFDLLKFTIRAQVG